MRPMTFARSAVVATRIPQGDAFTIPEGTELEVVQMLGGNFTVETKEGRLLRIDAKDAELIGMDAFMDAPDADVPQDTSPVDKDRVLDVLRTVFDPEIPINVVDLGLIYECGLQDVPGGGQRVEIRMSMTAPGCGMGDVLRDDVQQKLTAIPAIKEVDVQIVWEPPWDSSRMSEAAKLELGWL